MTESERKIKAEENRVRVSDFLTTDPDHLRDSSELAYLLGTTNREIRTMAQRERLEGIPVVATDRGYRLASSLEEYRRYAAKRQKYLEKEKRELELSVIAVTTKGFFQNESIV